MSDWHYVVTTNDNGEDFIQLVPSLIEAEKSFAAHLHNPYDYKRIVMGKCAFVSSGVVKVANLKRSFIVGEVSK